MWASFLFVNATNLVYSGTNIVLNLLAYSSLNLTRDFRDTRSLEKRAVSSAWPIADVTNCGRESLLG